MIKNSYYRPLSLPISPELATMNAIIESWKQPTVRGIIPFNADESLQKWMKTLDLTISFAEAFYTPPNIELGIHIDARDPLGVDRVKINWIYGAPASKMVWYEPVDPNDLGEDHVTPGGTVSRKFDKNKLHKVVETTLVSPCLLKVSRPHAVVNDTAEKRWCFSYTIDDLQTGKLLQWNTALERLQAYL